MTDTRGNISKNYNTFPSISMFNMSNMLFHGFNVNHEIIKLVAVLLSLLYLAMLPSGFTKCQLKEQNTSRKRKRNIAHKNISNTKVLHLRP